MAARKTPSRDQFPIRMTHPDIKDAVTHAASPSSLKVLENHGWKRGTGSTQSSES
jgi:hypothetical protein